ncbi:hypothetical protein THAOC_10531 [Thalassiosira oceanica]|uniref:Uncharacterized protein n=1 Tax=Thalassiosira oceanica TaxID=159749 RepID=K0TCT5_THAOC|nr:hypothetical protein THAOC_10531 [Thalassiosira oceanica]|eukprot:EJK68302.1 hypothetical protein THAOC_10531 [Thalassiosira oceanica]
MRGGAPGLLPPARRDVLVADVEPRTYQAEDLSDLPAFATWAAPADGGWSALAAGGVTVPSPELVRGRDREYAAAFSPDGTRLAISGVADETRVVAYPGYATVAVLGEAEGRSLRDVAWSPDGGLIALATSITNRAHQGPRGVARLLARRRDAGHGPLPHQGRVRGAKRAPPRVLNRDVGGGGTADRVPRPVRRALPGHVRPVVRGGGRGAAPRGGHREAGLPGSDGAAVQPGPRRGRGGGREEGGHGTASSHSVGTATTAENGEDGSTGGSSPATAPGPTPPALTGPTNSPPDDAGPPTDASPVNGGGSDAPEDGVVESGSDGADDPGIGPSSPAGSVFRVWRAEAFAVGLAIALLLV